MRRNFFVFSLSVAVNLRLLTHSVAYLGFVLIASESCGFPNVEGIGAWENWEEFASGDTSGMSERLTVYWWAKIEWSEQFQWKLKVDSKFLSFEYQNQDCEASHPKSLQEVRLPAKRRSIAENISSNRSAAQKFIAICWMTSRCHRQTFRSRATIQMTRNDEVIVSLFASLN